MSAADPYEEDTAGIFGSIAHAVTHAASGVVKTVGKPVAKVASKVTKVAFAPLTIPGNFVAKKMSKVPILGGVYNAAHRLATLPFTVTQQVIDGGRIDKVALANFKKALADTKTVGPWAQTVISFIPGIGTGVAAAIGAGLALAEGKSISEIMLAAVKGALPGGAVAQVAFNVAQGALQHKSIDQIAIGALPISDQQKQLLSQGLAAAKDIAAGKNVAHSIVDHAIQSLPPQYAKAVQIGMAMGHAKNLQEALKTGAMGAASIGASALAKTDLAKNALGSASNLLNGAKNTVNPFIAAAKQLGSSQAGIQKAIGAAQAIKNGSPVLKSALSSAVQHFVPNSPEHLGFNTAVSVLKQTAGNKAALGVARRALPSESARHAFDSAIGVISHTVSGNPAALAKRAGSMFTPMMGKAKGIISPYQPNLKNAIDSLTRNPTLTTQHPLVLANKFGTTQQTVLQALKHVGGQRLLPWRSLSPTASAFIQKWHSMAPMGALGHGSNNTAGLDETGTKYIVVKGDSPFSIAQKLVSNGNRWPELKAVNGDKKPGIDKNVWSGEVLNLPPSWQKPTVTASPGAALPSQPAPTRPDSPPPAPTFSTAPGTLQAKSILVAWSKTDGVNQAGIPDYGSSAADLSTDFGPRDSTELMSFQNWDNKFGSVGPKLAVDGKLGPKSLAALQQWTETRAQQAIPSGPIVSVPGQVTTLPEVLITASPPIAVPTAAIPVPVVASPPAPPTPVVINTATPAPPSPALPAVATPSQPAAPVASSSGGKMGPALAGAAIGGVIGGLPGAIIGGIAGAAIA